MLYFTAGIADMGSMLSGKSIKRCRWLRAVTLVECLIAAVVLSIAVIGVASSMGSTVRNVERGAERLEGIRLATRMLEEIAIKPISTDDGGRSGWGVDDYDGLEELPGTLTESSGESCVLREQVYTRRVAVEPCLLPDLSNGTTSYTGRRIIVVVESPNGWAIELTRCIPLNEVVP